MPIERLGLSVRCSHALSRHGIHTAEQIIGLTRAQLLSIRGLGVGMLAEIERQLSLWGPRTAPSGASDAVGLPAAAAGLSAAAAGLSAAAPSPIEPEAEPTPGSGALDGLPRPFGGRSSPPDTLAELIVAWLQTLDERNRRVVRARLGLGGEPPATLEEIGRSLGVTRERIRQVIRASLRRAQIRQWPVLFAPFIEGAVRLVEEMGGLLSEDELRRELPLALPLGDIDPLATAPFLAALGEQLSWFGAEHTLADSRISRSRIERIRSELHALVRAGGAPLAAHEVIARYLNAHLFDEPPCDEALVRACLRTDPRLEQHADGTVAQPGKHRVGRKERLVDALRAIGAPAHFADIAARASESLPADTPLDLRAAHACLGLYPETFVRVGQGRYGLVEWAAPVDAALSDTLHTVLRRAGRSLPLREVIWRARTACSASDVTIAVALAADNRITHTGKGRYALAR